MCVNKKPYNSHPDNKGSYPANTRHSPNAVSMLAHRLRRWSNIETALGECLVFAGRLSCDRKEPLIPRDAEKSVIKTLSSCGKPVAIHLTFSARANVSCLYMSHAKLRAISCWSFLRLLVYFPFLIADWITVFVSEMHAYSPKVANTFSFTYLNLSFSVERRKLWSEGIS